MQPSSERALFANQLRAVAVISVMLVHWFGVFWLARQTVSEYIFAPPPTGPGSTLLGWISFPTLNYGPFGVAIFFLISGFVIPFSLAKASPLEFIISRVLRIYPTYIFASMVALTFVWISSQYWGTTFHIDFNTLIRNLALIHSNTYYSTIDLVNWSLCVELKFYLVSALLYKAIRKGLMIHTVLFSLAVLAFTVAVPPALSPVHFSTFDLSIESIKTELMLVVYMFIGTCFYHCYVRNISPIKAVVYGVILLSICLACWPYTEWKSGIPYVPLNYIYGLVFFTAAYNLRHYFRPFRPVDFIAKISYPLYIIHSLVGYSLMRMALDLGLSFKASAVLSFIIVILISYLLHITIETHTAHAGRKMFSYYKKKRALKNPVDA